MVGDKTFPAGKIMTSGVTASEAGTVSISSLKDGQRAGRIGQRLPGSDDSTLAKLVFHKYGDRYYLAEIWVPGYKAWKIESSKSERAIKRETGLAQHATMEVVSVTAEQ